MKSHQRVFFFTLLCFVAGMNAVEQSALSTSFKTNPSPDLASSATLGLWTYHGHDGGLRVGEYDQITLFKQCGVARGESVQISPCDAVLENMAQPLPIPGRVGVTDVRHKWKQTEPHTLFVEHALLFNHSSTTGASASFIPYAAEWSLGFHAAAAATAAQPTGWPTAHLRISVHIQWFSYISEPFVECTVDAVSRVAAAPGGGSVVPCHMHFSNHPGSWSNASFSSGLHAVNATLRISLAPLYPLLRWQSLLASATEQLPPPGAFPCRLLSLAAVTANASSQASPAGSTTLHNSSAQAALPTAAAASISAGREHACGVFGGGSGQPAQLKCWGSRRYGRLGLGDVTIGHGFQQGEAALQLGSLQETRPEVIPVVPLPAGGHPLAVSVGVFHSCLLYSGGNVQCWGSGGNGWRLHGLSSAAVGGKVDVGGLPDRTPQLLPFLQFGEGVSQLHAGQYHSCAVGFSGAVRCWGSGSNGKLGQGSSSNMADGLQPGTPAVALSAAAVAASCGTAHTCALLISGKVQCWGSNQYLQLGLPSSAPAVVGGSPGALPDAFAPLGLPGPAMQVCTASAHTCALLLDGQVLCWGFVSLLGRGLSRVVGASTIDASKAAAAQLPRHIVHISCAGLLTCAVDVIGAVFCWGRGAAPEQMGINFKEDSGGSFIHGSTQDSTPIMTGPVPLPLAASTVSVGLGVTCVTFQANSALFRCWGTGDSGALGQGSLGSDGGSAPGAIADRSASVLAPLQNASVEANAFLHRSSSHATGLTLGESHGCVLQQPTGALRCWGDNDDGQLGRPAGASVPLRSTAQPSGAVDLTLQAVPLPHPVWRVATGGSFTCVILRRSMSVACWGGNAYGQIGVSSPNATVSLSEAATAPPPGTDLGGAVVELSAGRNHVCALRGNGQLYCWGDNSFGQISAGDVAAVGLASAPLAVGPLAFGAPVTAVSAGDKHTCAVSDDGRAKCWGLGSSGQLGNGASGESLSVWGNSNATTVRFIQYIELSQRIADISCSAVHTCVVTVNGSAQCWGSNADGQLAEQTIGQYGVPAAVSPAQRPFMVTPLAVARIFAGPTYSCVVYVSGDLSCFGDFPGLDFGASGKAQQLKFQGPQRSEIVPLPGVVTHVTGNEHTLCALVRGGAAACWGEEEVGGGGNPLLAGIDPPQIRPSAGAFLNSRIMIIGVVLPGAAAVMNAVHTSAWLPASNLQAAAVVPANHEALRTLGSLPAWLHTLTHQRMTQFPQAQAVGALSSSACSLLGAVHLQRPLSLRSHWGRWRHETACMWGNGTTLASIMLPFCIRSRTGEPCLPSQPAETSTGWSALGGEVLQLQGAFWPLIFGQVQFSIYIGPQECRMTGEHLSQSASVLMCTSSALQIGNGERGAIQVSLRAHWPSGETIVLSSSNFMRFADPVVSEIRLLSAPRPAPFPTAGGLVEVTGTLAFWQQLVHTSVSPFYARLVKLSVFAQLQSKQPIGQCVVQQLSFNKLLCMLPGGVGAVWLEAERLGGAHSPRILVQYAQPVISTVSPYPLVWSPRPGTGIVGVSGYNLGPGEGHSNAIESSAEVSVWVGDIACSSVRVVSPTYVECTFYFSALPSSTGRVAVRLSTSPELQGGSAFFYAQTFGRLQLKAIVNYARGDGEFLEPSGNYIAIEGENFVFAPSIQAISPVGLEVRTDNQVLACPFEHRNASSMLCFVRPGVGKVGAITVRRTMTGGNIQTAALNTSLQFAPTKVTSCYSLTSETAERVIALFPGQLHTLMFSGERLSMVRSLWIEVAAEQGADNETARCVSSGTVTNGGFMCLLKAPAGISLDSRQFRFRTGGTIIPADFPETIKVLRKPLAVTSDPSFVGRAVPGSQIDLLGFNLGAQSSDLLELSFAGVPCRARAWLGSDRLRCIMGSPPLNTLYNATSTHYWMTATFKNDFVVHQRVSIVHPFITRVEGGYLLASSEAAHRTAISAQGFFGSVQHSSTGVSFLIAGVDCETHGGGRLRISTNEAICSNFSVAALQSVAPSTGVKLLTVEVHVHGSRTAVLESAIQLMAPPAVLTVRPLRVAVNGTMVAEGNSYGWSRSNVSAVSIAGVTLPASSWTWRSDSVIIYPVPSHTELGLSATAGHVQVHMQSGSVSRASPASQFHWDVPNARPQLTPRFPCAYRELDGTAHVLFAWHQPASAAAEELSGWAVHAATSTNPWFGLQEAPEQVLLTDLQPLEGNFTSDAQRLAACGALPTLAAAHNLHVYTAAVPSATNDRSVWFKIAAVAERDNRALDGPMSACTVPLLPRCSLAGSGDEYVSTQFVSSAQAAATVEAWAQVKCRACPVGATCRGQPFEFVGSAAGHRRASWVRSDLVFVPCDQSNACQASSQVATANRMAQYAQAVSLLAPAGVQVSAVSSAATAATGEATLATPADAAMCALGYTGRLCSSCSYGYSRAADGVCSECASPAVVSALCALGVLLCVAVVAYMILSTLRASSQTELHTALNKLLFTHLQMIGIASAFPFQWPAALQGMFVVFQSSSSVSTTLLSVDCLLQPHHNAFFVSSLVPLLLPLAALLILSCAWGAHWAHREGKCRRLQHTARQPGDSASAGSAEASSAPIQGQGPSPVVAPPPQRSRRSVVAVLKPQVQAAAPSTAAAMQQSATQTSRAGRAASMQATVEDDNRAVSAMRGFIVSLLVVAFLLHLSLVKAALGLMTCVTIAGRSFLAGDLNIECNDTASQQWMYGVGMPALLVYGLGIPAACWAVLACKRSQLTSSAVQSKYGFLYLTYKPRFWWWETVALLRKVFLAVVAVFFAPFGAGVQSTAATVLLVLSLHVHASAQPYQSVLVNRLESGSLVVALVTICGGASLVDPRSSEGAKVLVSTVTLLVNAVFIAAVVTYTAVAAIRSDGARGMAQRLKLQRVWRWRPKAAPPSSSSWAGRGRQAPGGQLLQMTTPSSGRASAGAFKPGHAKLHPALASSSSGGSSNTMGDSSGVHVDNPLLGKLAALPLPVPGRPGPRALQRETT